MKHHLPHGITQVNVPYPALTPEGWKAELI